MFRSHPHVSHTTSSSVSPGGVSPTCHTWQTGAVYLGPSSRAREPVDQRLHLPASPASIPAYLPRPVPYASPSALTAGWSMALPYPTSPSPSRQGQHHPPLPTLYHHFIVVNRWSSFIVTSAHQTPGGDEPPCGRLPPGRWRPVWPPADLWRTWQSLSCSQTSALAQQIEAALQQIAPNWPTDSMGWGLGNKDGRLPGFHQTGSVFYTQFTTSKLSIYSSTPSPSTPTPYVCLTHDGLRLVSE